MKLRRVDGGRKIAVVISRQKGVAA